MNAFEGKMEMMRVPPLHAAVWDGNVDVLTAMLMALQSNNNEYADTQGSSVLQQALDARDAHGNTALHLALRVVQPTQHAIIRLLLDFGANTRARNHGGWSCIHDATLCDDEYLLALLFMQGEKQHGAFLESRQDAFFEALEKLPDFEGEIYIRAHSWVPMVSKILPSDTIRIWKRGTQLRCDSALKGLDGIKWKHGRMSHILMGRESAQPGHAIVIDHEGKSFYDVTHALIDPSLTNIDLGLHRLLTAPLSSASMDSTQLMFHKLKDVTKIKPKKEHPCPWTGTKYRMENFSIAAQFRPVVDPKRSHREMQSADTIVDNLQQFVNTLSLHSHKKEHKKKAKDKKQSEQDIEASAASDDEFSNGNNSDRKQVLHLTKGKKMEMHLDVVAGDIIKWNFLSRSKEFSFLATYFHEDAQAVVCRTEGVKNIPIIGEFQVEGNGSFVLSWMNTQKGFTLDRKGIKLKYDVSHTRPAATVPFAEPSTQTSSVLIEEKCELSENQRQQNDEEKCRVFHHPEHIPNPLTTTTSFSEYFFGPAIKAAAESAAIEDEKTKEDTKPKLSSLFKRKPGSENSPPASRVAASNAAAAALSNQESIMKQDGYRNTFRSITKLPATRNLSKSFEAKVLMAESFPFSLVDFLPVITFLSITGEHVKNLEEFFHMTLPPGFPVKFELPMMLTVRIAYTFQSITLAPDLSPALFEIPQGYQQVFAMKDVRT